MDTLPTLHDAYLARNRIAPYIRETPAISAPELAAATGAASVHLKLECLQNTGAFKVRGAANKILGLSDAEKRTGVITFSTGNHGKAVAYVAGQAGIPATVCLSEHVAPYRAEAIRALGAEVSLKGKSQDEAEANYHELTRERGLTPVVPFDDPMVIAGQGTIALELLAALPETEVLLVPLSGGGLLAGIATVAKTINPKIRTVGSLPGSLPGHAGKPQGRPPGPGAGTGFGGRLTPGRHRRREPLHPPAGGPVRGRAPDRLRGRGQGRDGPYL